MYTTGNIFYTIILLSKQLKGCVFMINQYTTELKRKLCIDICINGKSTIKTAEEYNIPLKTLEKWITAFNKNNHCFDPNSEENDFKLIEHPISNTPYDELSKEELKKQLMKKDIEIARLKKGYLVKGVGQENKVYVTFSKKNTK